VESVRVPTGRRSWTRVASAIVFCVALTAVARSSYRDPVWNFDTVMYVTTALSLSVHDPVERHRLTYEELRTALPPPAFTHVSVSTGYRKALYDSPTALDTQLRLSVKPAYVGMIAALHGLGVNAARASRLISAAAFLLLALVVIAWLWTSEATPRQMLAAGLLLCAPPFPEMAGMATPDMAAAVPIVAGGWLLLTGAPMRGLCIAGIAIFFRPDTVVMVLLLVAWAALFAETPRLPARRAVVVAAAVTAVAFLLPRLLGGAPLPVILHHSLESPLFEPARMNESVTLAGYLAMLRRGLSGERLYYPSVMSLHLAITAVGMVAIANRPWPAQRPVIGWLALTWSYLPIHYLLFPDRSDRYFAPTYLLAGLATICFALRSPRQPS
jgi:hypothetical protein